jgi:hypothetical protein
LSNVSSEKALNHAVALIRHADELTHKWSAHLITVQTSLVTLEAALVAWRGEANGITMPLVSILIATLGIVLTYVLTNILTREHDHGHVYIKMAMRAEGENPILFRPVDPRVSGIQFRTVILILRITLFLAWAAVIAISALVIAQTLRN